MRFRLVLSALILCAPLMPRAAAAAVAVPILYNDRYIDADALIRNGRILVPLRPVFSRIGAFVTYDPATRTAVISKAGVVVNVQMDRPAFLMNGFSRPLEEPSTTYRGSVFVPARILTEAFGATVGWRTPQSVAVSYNPAPVQLHVDPPIANVAAAREVPPMVRIQPGAPIPKDTPEPETFIAIDGLITPSAYNAFNAGAPGLTDQSFAIRGAAEFTLLNQPWSFGGSATRYAFPHANGTVIGLDGVPVGMPASTVRETSYDLHLSAQLTPSKVYAGFGYASLMNNAAYPRVGGLGAGFEKLPDLNARFSYGGYAWYYPNVAGTCACGAARIPISYAFLRFRGGFTYAFGSRFFIDAGFEGDRGYRKSGAPSNFSHATPQVGAGIHL